MEAIHNPTHGLRICTALESLRSAHSMHSPKEPLRLPTVHHVSTLLAMDYHRAAVNAKVSGTDLRSILFTRVAEFFGSEDEPNSNTAIALKNILNGGYLAPSWKHRLVIKADSDYGRLLMGTEIGTVVAMMLLRHRSWLGRKAVHEITVSNALRGNASVH